MTFSHILLHSQGLEKVDIDGKRFYKSPDGDLYKSVTTIIGEQLPKPYLKIWRKKVGDAEADKIMLQAANRGTAVHTMCERYLMNDENWKKGMMPFNVETFKVIKKILDDYVTDVYGIELALYSKHLKAAGRIDLVCRFNDEITLVDFKTSKWAREEKDIYSYFLQLTAYSIMLEERYDITAKQCVIIMAVDGGACQIFDFNRNKYLEETINLFKENSNGNT